MSVELPGIQDLLAEQVAAAHKVIETSRAIKEHLAAQGIHIDLPKSFLSPQHEQYNAADKEASHKSGLTEPLLLPDAKVETSPKRRESEKPTIRGLFPDQATLKSRLFESSYNVEDLYSETGKAQSIARNDTFQNITFLMIVLNAFWIGIATDYNKAAVLTQAPVWVQLMEQLFCLFFTLELAVRFFAFKHWCDAISDGWFCFDFVLIAFMVYETWIEPVLFTIFRSASPSDLSSFMVLRIFRLSRLTRLTRIARIARLLRQVPELAILTKSLVLAMRSVGATLVMLIIGIYVFSVFFTQLLSEEEAGKGQFETVLMGMHTLLVDGILADQADIINGMLAAGVAYYWAMILYMLIVGITIADMLIGVISKVIESVADAEEEARLKEDLREKTQQIVKEVDENRDKTISRAELGRLLHNEAVTQHLHGIGVDVIALVEFADLIFTEDVQEISNDDFISIVLGFRETAPTTKHQFELKKFMRKEFAVLEGRLR